MFSYLVILLASLLAVFLVYGAFFSRPKSRPRSRRKSAQDKPKTKLEEQEEASMEFLRSKIKGSERKKESDRIYQKLRKQLALERRRTDVNKDKRQGVRAGEPVYGKVD